MKILRRHRAKGMFSTGSPHTQPVDSLVSGLIGHQHLTFDLHKVGITARQAEHRLVNAQLPLSARIVNQGGASTKTAHLNRSLVYCYAKPEATPMLSDKPYRRVDLL